MPCGVVPKEVAERVIHDLNEGFVTVEREIRGMYYSKPVSNEEARRISQAIKDRVEASGTSFGELLKREGC